MPKRVAPALVAVVLAAVGSPAMAQLPPPVRAMIDAAIEGGDPAKVATVLDLARATNPDAIAEIDTIRDDWNARQAAREEERRQQQDQQSASAGLFDLWSGEGQLGGFHSSGNTDAVGLSAALRLQRKGEDWTHLLRGSADYQRSGGTTSREQYFAAYEPRIQVSENVFAYGLAQFEHNRFQGFDARYAVSGGLGIKVIDADAIDLSLKAGPAYRRTEFVTGMNDSRIGGLAAVDFDWRIADGVTLTQDTNLVTEGGAAATVIVDSRTTTINLVTGLDARITGRLRSRFSYAVDYDSNPPAGSVSTDTISRISLVYGF